MYGRYMQPSIAADREQPGRLFGMFFFSPYLFYKGLVHKDLSLRIFAVLLFIYELYWVLFYQPGEKSKVEFLRSAFT